MSHRSAFHVVAHHGTLTPHTSPHPVDGTATAVPLSGGAGLHRGEPGTTFFFGAYSTTRYGGLAPEATHLSLFAGDMDYGTFTRSSSIA
ncbi:hypothetical protein WKI65_06610 [Streptomyces sp. MS1.AVA.3]|uniref:hypothetical protein n=1 Tax=Streptomyces decoyicus TaxID=249567 RepID=UPI0030BD5B3F